jgi:succinate-semialdehyde dehydrogenase/glutarate-semialdehyde dehydrogenase
MAIVKKLDTPEGARKRLQLLSPADLEPIGEIEAMTAEDVKAALDKARLAQQSWARLSFDERAQYILKGLDVLVARQDEFIEVILKETPKTRNEALMMDILTSCDAMLYYAKQAKKILKTEKRTLHGLIGMTKKLQVHYLPLGVIGVVSPWNAPFILSLNPTVQALMAGNAVLIKPSSATAFSGGLVGKIFEQAGLPEGLVTILQGDSSTGQALLEVGVDKISFTGSEGVGRHVGVTCAERFIPCSLELGGKNPFIVCADANIDYAAGAAVAGNFLNAGQYCGGNEISYVEQVVAEAFTQKVATLAKQLRQSNTGEFDVGGLYTEDQLKLVEELVEDAINKGATVLAGGKRNPDLKGLYFEPTVLTDLTADMRVLNEEAFGPVMCIVPVASAEEAIARTNATNYGLTASVWSTDIDKATDIGTRIRTGCIDINAFASSYGTIEAPFGGRKASGIGQVNGPSGLRSYCHAMPVQVDRFKGKQAASMYPKSTKDDDGFQKFIKFLYGTRFGRMLAMLRLPF